MIRQLLDLFGVGDDPLSYAFLPYKSTVSPKKSAQPLPDGEATQVKRLLDDEPRKLEDA